MSEYEKDKIIIKLEPYVYSSDVKSIFKEELLNENNKNLLDVARSIQERIHQLSIEKSPETKERVLLDRINDLYQKVKGERIDSKILYNGGFLDILKETYKLPNDKTVEKEKVVKNGGKNAVVVIALTEDKKFIITVQNRINDKQIAEYPSGYIEEGEDPLVAARRELLEETGYATPSAFVLDEVYTSPGIDNSTTYIVVANLCTKTSEVVSNGSELVNYGLFNEEELKYMIKNNIMSGAISKLAYYNFVNNVSEDIVYHDNSFKSIYEKIREQ